MEQYLFKCEMTASEAVADMDEYIRECVDVPGFVRYCETCPFHGAVWSCPPFDFDPMEIWNAYRHLLVIAHKVIVPEDLASASLGQEELARISDLLIAPYKRDLLRELLSREKRIRGSLALSAGRCGLCPRCARSDGEPCRRPESLRHSMEALGADVSKTVERYLGDTLQWGKNGQLPPYYYIVGGLLLP